MTSAPDERKSFPEDIGVGQSQNQSPIGRDEDQSG